MEAGHAPSLHVVFQTVSATVRAKVPATAARMPWSTVARVGQIAHNLPSDVGAKSVKGLSEFEALPKRCRLREAFVHGWARRRQGARRVGAAERPCRNAGGRGDGSLKGRRS
eukprot:115922-Alexandrium_andersonii.AAC.1